MMKNIIGIQTLIGLKNQAAMITGADRGIGQAIAIRLAEAGADLYLTGMDQQALNSFKEHLEQDFNINVEVYAANLLERGIETDLIERASNHFPHLSILVNNAGIFPQQSTTEISDESFDRVISINLRSAFILSREFAKRLIEHNSQGVILNILSISALASAGNPTHYVASKHALAGVTKSMAAELGKYRIRVLALAPGLIMTPGLTDIMAQDLAAEESFNEYAESLPLGRAGEPDDVARAALFAVSELASYMTGTIITIDGGDLAT